MPVNVGRIIVHAAAATGLKQGEFLKAVADFVSPSGSGDSDPTKSTILSYAKVRKTRCGHKFAGMVLDFLHDRRGQIVDGRKLELAQDLCRDTLLEYKELRFHQPARHNPASLHRVSEIAGAYILFRRATRDHGLRQELLVLVEEGEAGHHTTATYVTPEVVGRGQWSVVRNTMSCMTTGFRPRWRPDVVNFHLLYEEAEGFDSPVFLSGFVSGLTSVANAEPATVAALGIRLLTKEELNKRDICRIGNFGDAEIRYAWHLCCEPLSKYADMIDNFLVEAVKPDKGALIRRPGMDEAIAKAARNIDDFIPSPIRAFCNDFSISASWTPRARPPTEGA
jgi:hypothetical protein